ncbi:uncharacterized protein LOC114876214 [Osmia bicornis bicornis]|uniref:uncharacterized protein LOC114876214 n=1 Tax=Osmia bicornis bicornis TaxID=1437191 RepID=UPI001EAEECB5|nr:uncharacterized protein LOC114876214 [Osmia bicornis bicornis]
MPAEIDTGGPTVLHCDYRAVCPIPILTSAITESSSLYRENRVVRTSIVRRFPRTNRDEKDESLDDTGLKSRCWSGFSFRRTGAASARSVLRGLRRNKPHISFNVPTEAIDVSSRTADDRQDCQHEDTCGPEQPESRLRDTIDQFDENRTIRQTRSRREECSLEHERTISRRFQARIQLASKTGHEKEKTSHDCHGVQGWCSKRDLSATGNWTEFRVANQTGIGKARFSSQSNDPSRSNRTYEKVVTTNATSTLPSLTDETWKEVDATNSWRCESRATKVELTVDRQTDFPSLDHESSSRSGHTRTRKKRRECRNNRFTYFQLALLFFLLAFGQCGLRKSSVFNCSAKSSATGLSVLAIGTVISAVSAAPVDLMADAGVRAERSANLSHITGASRKIQMYIKNRHLQILPDGTVNGSNDDTSDYTIFQRMSVSRGQLRIQGVATCLYLCMDSCGLLYGSREYTDDCVFNETLEQHNYNTYSSAKWSTAKKTLYLGLNRRGQPRRVQAKGHNLGRLSAYARVLTQVAPSERVEALQRRMLGAQHNVRHRHNVHRGDLIQQSLCPTLPVQEKDGRDKFRCRKRKKRKKRKRRCRPGEKPGPQCQIVEEKGEGSAVHPVRSEAFPSNGTSLESKRSCEGAASEEACRREALSVPSKKRKLRVQEAAEVVATVGRNVTGNSNGKSKAPASNAKKVHAAGSMSQSKKPNLTDGKKKKKKGPAARRNGAVPLPRKRFTPGSRTDNTSAVPTATPVPIFATSFSSWWSPGVSTAPSERGVSPRRRGKQASSRKNQSSGNPRRVGKAFGKNRAKTIDRAVNTYETTVNPDQSVTVKVPQTVSDRSIRNSSSLSPDDVADDVPRSESSLSESLFIDEDASSTFSNEHVTAVMDSTTSIEATGTSSTFGLLEEENKSVEEVADSTDESDRFDTPEIIQSTTTPGIPFERLAM